MRELVFAHLLLSRPHALRLSNSDSLEKAPGRKKEERLYDVPEEVRAYLGEKGIAGPTATGTSSRCGCTVCSSGQPMTVSRSGAAACATSATTAEVKASYSTLLTKTPPPTLWGCLKRSREEEDEGLTHPDDVKSDQFEGM